MGILQNKIDFVAFASVTMVNPNGDPLNGKSPRTDYNGLGEMSDVCIKRKLRNRMQDLGYAVFVQSADRCDDGCGSLSERASASLGKAKDPTSMHKRPVKHGWMYVLLDRYLPSKTPKVYPLVCGVRSPSIRVSASLRYRWKICRLRKVLMVRTAIKGVPPITWA